MSVAVSRLTVAWQEHVIKLLLIALNVTGTKQQHDDEDIPNVPIRAVLSSWEELVQTCQFGRVPALSPGQLYELATRDLELHPPLPPMCDDYAVARLAMAGDTAVDCRTATTHAPIGAGLKQNPDSLVLLHHRRVRRSAQRASVQLARR